MGGFRLFAGVGLLLTLPAFGAVTHRLSAPGEAEFAAKSIIYDLAQLKSPTVRLAREHCGTHCGDEGGAIETTIGLLGVGGPSTTASLLNLLSVELDAGEAESRDCQIAKRGKALVPALKQLDATRASNWCRQTFRDLSKRELADLNDVSAQEICRPSREVEADRKEWIKALQSERNLFAESGLC